MKIDPFAADFALDELPGDVLHQVLRAHRERGPITPTRFLGIPSFLVTGYDALVDAFLDTHAFPPHRMYQAAFEPAIGRSFISMDDSTQHRVYRRLATPAFRSRAIERYEREDLGMLARELLAPLAEREAPVDLVAEFTARFPYLVITRMLGLPRDREEAFHHWAVALLRFRDDPVAARDAARELTDVLLPIVAARRDDPRDDIITGLVKARVDGRVLDDEEVCSHIRLLIPTGGETIHGTLGNLIHALLTRPEVWGRLRETPARIPDAVDEGLRLESSIAVLPRMSRSEPVVFRDVEIPADSWVLFAIAAANRDPSVYADPDHFDLDRGAKDALTFGRGVKSCPGMHLARKDLAVAVETLLALMPDARLLDLRAALPRRSVLRSPDALRVLPRPGIARA